MNNYKIIILVSFFFRTLLFAQAWKQKEDIPPYGNITRAVSFTIGDKGYTGLGGGPIFSTIISEYNPANNKWRKLPDMPGKRRISAAAFVVGGKAYVGTGDAYDEDLNDFYEYNPSKDKWKKIDDFPSSPRHYAVAFSIGDFGFTGLGSSKERGNDLWGFDTSVTYYNDFWKYDVAKGKWTQAAEFPGKGRSRAISFTVGNKAYVGLGYGHGSLNDLWEYDPTKDKWTKKGQYPGKLTIASVCFTIGDKAYIGTGLGNPSSASITNEFWEYDVLNNSWKQITNYPGKGGFYNAAFSIGKIGYVGSGAVKFDKGGGATVYNDFWSYEASKDSLLKSKAIKDVYVLSLDKDKQKTVVAVDERKNEAITPGAEIDFRELRKNDPLIKKMIEHKKEGNADVILFTFTKDEIVITVYKKIIHSWGGVYYFKDKRAITEEIFKSDTAD